MKRGLSRLLIYGERFADSENHLNPIGSAKFANMGLRFLRKTFGLRDQDRSGHHEIWFHIDLVERWDLSPTHDDKFNFRIQVKERSAPYHYERQKRGSADVMSDDTLSSYCMAINVCNTQVPPLALVPRRAAHFHRVKR